MSEISKVTKEQFNALVEERLYAESDSIKEELQAFWEAYLSREEIEEEVEKALAERRRELRKEIDQELAGFSPLPGGPQGRLWGREPATEEESA